MCIIPQSTVRSFRMVNCILRCELFAHDAPRLKARLRNYIELEYGSSHLAADVTASRYSFQHLITDIASGHFLDHIQRISNGLTAGHSLTAGLDDESTSTADRHRDR